MEPNKQHHLVSCLASNPELFAICHAIIKADYFDPSVRKAVRFMQEFFVKHKGLPSLQAIKAETSVELESLQVHKAEVDYVAAEVETLCRNQAITSAIIKSVELLEKQDTGAIEKLIKEAVSLGLTKDLGVDYFADPEKRMAEADSAFKPMSTGLPELDGVINGGLMRQEIILFMANSGVGKSIFLANIGAYLVAQGLNVVYITLELADKIVAKRFDSMITGIEQFKLQTNKQMVIAEIEKRRESYGKLQIKRMPESVTSANQIRAYVKQLQLEAGWDPDVIIIDYLDIMATNNKVAADNLFIKDKYLTEEARALGAEFNCAVLSASQMGRAALDAEEINQGHIQGGISKVNTADFLLAIIQDNLMRDAGEYVIQVAKARNAPTVGKTITLGWDAKTLRVTSLLNGSTKKLSAEQAREEKIKSTKSLLDLMKS